MSKKYKFMFVLIALAFVAVVVGLGCIFFGNVDVHDVKVESLNLQTVDGDYVLVAQYNNKFDYRFTVEKFIDDDYYVIDTVKTASNTLNLSKRDINFVVGSKFRFSACYTTENDLNGTRSDFLLWNISGKTVAIDYDSVDFANEVLSWSAVEDATNYKVIVVDDAGEKNVFDAEEQRFSFSNLKVGNYRVYVCSVIGGGEIDFSKIGQGTKITLRRTNLISNAEFDGQNITFDSKEDVESAEIYVDGDLVATANIEKVVKDAKIECKIKNCGFILSGVDFESQSVQIRTLSTNFVFESSFLSI